MLKESATFLSIHIFFCVIKHMCVDNLSIVYGPMCLYHEFETCEHFGPTYCPNFVFLQLSNTSLVFHNEIITDCTACNRALSSVIRICIRCNGCLPCLHIDSNLFFIFLWNKRKLFHVASLKIYKNANSLMADSLQ